LYDDGEGWPEGDEEDDNDNISEGNIQLVLQSPETKLSEETKSEKKDEPLKHPIEEIKEVYVEITEKEEEELKIGFVSPSKPHYEVTVPEDGQDHEEGGFHFI
jgi:hypothetical protein